MADAAAMNDGLHPRLTVIRGGQVLAEHVMAPGAEIVLGRADGCQVTIGDASVSRMHARIRADEHGVYVEDLGSANGTFVDGERITGRLRLADGQLVRVAQKMLTAPTVVRLDAAPAPAAAAIVEPDPDSTSADEPAPFLAPPPPLAPPATLPTTTRPITTILADPEPIEPPTRPQRPPPGSQAPKKRSAVLPILIVIALVGIAAAGGLALWLFGGPGPLARLGLAGAPSPTPAPPPAPVPSAAVLPAAMPAPVAPAPATDATSTLETALASATSSDVEPSATADTSPAAAEPTPPPEMAAAPGDEATPAATPTPAPISVEGRWTIQLQNLFYPEDDYVVELRLDLRQRRNGVDGEGQISIEGRAMSFRVPRASGTGSLRRGPPATLKIELPFPRPIGVLQLEGEPQGDVMAGTFRSSLFKQQGTWQGTRQPR